MDRLYISDLDGTLLRDDAALSEFSREHLTRLLDAGLLFTVASARSVVSIRIILGDLPLRLPVIANNGAFVSDLHTGKHAVAHFIDTQAMGEVFEFAARAGLRPMVSVRLGEDGRVYIPEQRNEGMEWYYQDRIRVGDPRIRPWAERGRDAGEQVVSMSFIDQREVIERLRAEIAERFDSQVALNAFENRYTPGWFWLVVQDRRSTKDQAIRDLVEMAGLADKDVVVFGDHWNDISMFDAADWAVAVGNAADELKERADEVIGTNDEDSVVKYLLRDGR